VLIQKEDIDAIKEDRTTANLDLLSYIYCKIEKQQKMIKYAKSIFS
jgi:hypothetical protein